jgi:hypothetical protein
MIFTQVLINQLRGDKSRKKTAREELWKAQGCDLFYSPEKQGLCRHTLRKAAYRALLGAERITREKDRFNPSLINFDFDFDGGGEYLFQDAKINCYIQRLGAGIFELDYLPKTWNYLDTCCPGMRRTAFADCLLPSDLSPEELLKCRPKGGRFCGEENYECTEMDKVRGKVSFRIPPSPELPFGQIEIGKTYTLKKDTLGAEYVLANRGDSAIDLLFAPAIDLSFPGEGESFVRFFRCKPGVKDSPVSDGMLKGAESLKIQDLKNEVQIQLSSSRSFDACIRTIKIPIEIQGKESDQYQSNCVIPFQSLSLKPGEEWSCGFSLRFSH